MWGTMNLWYVIQTKPKKEEGAANTVRHVICYVQHVNDPRPPLPRGGIGGVILMLRGAPEGRGYLVEDHI